MAMNEELDVFFDVSEFADEAIIISKGVSFSVNGIYDNGDVMILEIETSNPSFICKYSDVSTVVRGDNLTVLGRQFLIVRSDLDPSRVVATMVLEKK